MITTIKAKHFRKHVDLNISMMEGFNALKGANESGKSTLQEIILYALYGAKALRTSLSDTVTWGHKEGELKVEVTLFINGNDYTFSRSKAGAECNYGDELVTGQTEVSNFAAELLGADYKTASLLMMASQSGLRGALDEGPAAVSSLISRLAEFDMIDTLLERAGERLLTGGDQTYRERLEEAQKDLEAMKSESVGDELPALLEEKDVKVKGVTHLSVAVSEIFRPAQNAAYQKYNDLVAAKEKREQVEAALDACKKKQETLSARYREALHKAMDKPNPDEIEALQKQIADDEAHQRVLRAYAEFQSLPAYPADYWDESEEKLEAEEKQNREAQAEKVSKVANLDIEYRKHKVSLIDTSNGKCPTCGHDVKDDEHVQKQNTEHQAEMARVAEEKTRAINEHAELQQYGEALKSLRKVATPFVKAAVKLAEFVDVDASVYPPRLSWKGEVPQVQDTQDAKVLLDLLLAQRRTADQASGQSLVLHEQMNECDEENTRLLMVWSEMPDVTQALADAGEEYNKSSRELSEKVSELEIEQEELKALNLKIQVLQSAIETRKVRVADLEKRVEQLNADIKSLAFNNTLVKKLRSLKPTITDKLWQTVLAAASTFFSQMRGEKSVVTKEASGFKVNGEAVASLSGSTLDTLALAIRVALSKTFISGLSFMILDEAAAGCDADRTMNMLGFLSTIGLKQVILATHDGVSEAVADNVIRLG